MEESGHVGEPRSEDRSACKQSASFHDSLAAQRAAEDELALNEVGWDR
jgi:hypothetical protein